MLHPIDNKEKVTINSEDDIWALGTFLDVKCEHKIITLKNFNYSLQDQFDLEEKNKLERPEKYTK
jgi:hypothetical protein